MRQYLLKKDKHDPRDLLYSAPHPVKASTPDSVDPRPQLSSLPIFDQGSLGSCTANAIVGLKEYNDHIDNTAAEGYYINLSRLFLYWQERNYEGTVNEDSGAYIRDGFRALNKIGVCGESFFPYDESKFTQTPSADAVENAALHKMDSYYRVYLVQLKQVLAEGNPVAIGIDVYSSFESDEVARTGYVPMPTPGETLLGGHCVLAVGYTPTHVICRNSWGAEWGDKGYFYLPWEFFDHYVSDMWTGK